MAPARKKQRLSNGDAAPVEAESISKPDQQRRSLFVRSLPANATSESLTELFSESYPIRHATAVIDQATKQCRGYGFVTFAAAEDAQRAKEEFNGHVWEGRKLRIEVAEPRHRDAEKAKEEGIPPVKVKHKPEDVPQPSRLIVRNLPWTIKTSEDLAKLFMSYGKVKQAYLPKKKNRLLAGFGFVVLRGRKNAEKALEGVNGREVDGRSLAVDWAVSKDVYEDLLNKGRQDGDSGEDAEGDDDRNAGAVDGVESDDASGDGEGSDGGSDAENDDESDAEGTAVHEEESAEMEKKKTEDRSTTVFVRNLPFTCTDEDLEDHFSAFGNTRYARVVMDPVTERSRGTGFVCFYKKEDADACLRGAPRRTVANAAAEAKDAKAKVPTNSILQNEEMDPSGKYTLEGRVLQVSPTLDKSEAQRLTEEGAGSRRKSREDKRRLYLLSEGTISSRSPLYEKLSPTERNMREASAKQRKSLIESNPSLHLSLTRLSVRNIPRSVGSKELKALAREAVVGFATDVKAGIRQPLSKEELSRGGEEMQAAEHARKKAGKGVVKQAKVVFEGASGSKVSEDSGAGRSRGYGFIEYYTHRNALMGLRWLNGHLIEYKAKDNSKSKAGREEIQDRKKRLIVEFAIENAQVVLRRNEKENKARERSLAVEQGQSKTDEPEDGGDSKPRRSLKRKRVSEKLSAGGKSSKRQNDKVSKPAANAERNGACRERKPDDEKIAHRNQVIGRKRAMRRARKAVKA